MAIILFIYSTVLALGLWQDEQNRHEIRNHNEDQCQGC